MALLFHLNKLDNVKGRHDRIVKLSYRDTSLLSRIIPNGEGDILINETFEWPIARPMEATELISVELYNYNKFITNRLVGRYGIYCQELMQIGNISLRDNLTDANNTVLKTCVEFEITYHSPDGSVGEWNALGFDFPLFDPNMLEALDNMEQSIDRGSVRDDMSLLSVSNQVERFGGSTYVLNYGQAEEGEDAGTIKHPSNSLMQHINRQFAPTLDKAFPKDRHFQVAITIHEARNLSGLDIDPAVVVSVGDQQRCTNIRKSTNCPFFNEFFAFDFNVPKEMFMDNVITVAVISANPLMQAQGVLKNYFQLGKTLGVHKMDVSYVWAEKGHQFVNKWAPLMDPNNFAAGNRGFVKCTIVAMSSNNPVECMPVKTVDDDDFEKNLMLPMGIMFPRQPIRFTIKIYKARDLPRMDLGVVASIKKALTSANMALCDPCVRVTFGTVSDKTSVKRACYNPVWNQEITFTDLSPPLYKRFKVQLVDHNPLRDDVIATHFISLAQICSRSKKHGFRPTFGPCWVNMYGANRTYEMLDKHNYLNQGFGEGVAYRGSLLMSVSTSTSMTSAGSFGAIVQPTQLISSMAAGPMADFFLFCSFLHATMIDAKLAGKPIQFEISIGNYGNQLDGTVHVDVPNLLSDEDDEGEEDEDGDRKTRQQKAKSVVKETFSTTNAMIPETEDKIYYHMPFEVKKPCVFVKARFEDQRRRMYAATMLDKMIERMEKSVNEIEEVIKREVEQYKPHILLKDLMQKVSTDCNTFVNAISRQQGHQQAGVTPLDKERLTMHVRKVGKISKTLRKMRIDVTEMNVKEMLAETRKIWKKMKKIAIEPQHGLPDVFIWMICAGKRVASVRIPSREILFSNVNEEMGKNCGKMQILLLKLAGKDATQKKGWVLQAKLFVYLWLGLNKHRSSYMKGLPSGYVQTTTIAKSMTDVNANPPKELVYADEDCHKFQLRAHLYQARSLLGSDETGLSDPYVRVFCGKASGRSHYLRATLCPTWNETVVLNKIIYHFNLDYIVKEPPPVVVEVFDKDFLHLPIFGVDEYIGRMMIKPEVLTLEDGNYNYPRLIWWPLWRSRFKAGEILAAFELIQLDADEKVPEWIPNLDAPVAIDKKHQVTRVPKEITPKINHVYRCEVMFWGVRALSRVRFMQVQNPFIVFEFAGKTLKSSMIENTEKTLNFKDPVRYVDVLLPDESAFHPPITILCNGSIAFGGRVLIGSSSMSSVEKYFDHSGDAAIDAAEKGLSVDDLDTSNMDDARSNVLMSEMLNNLVTPANFVMNMPGLNLSDLNPLARGGVLGFSRPSSQGSPQRQQANGGASDEQISLLVPAKSTSANRTGVIGRGNADDISLAKSAPPTPTPGARKKKSSNKAKDGAGAKKGDEEEEVIDWWSRYYASWAEKTKLAELEAKRREEEEERAARGGDMTISIPIPIPVPDAAASAAKVGGQFKKVGTYMKTKASSKLEGITNPGFNDDGVEEITYGGEEVDGSGAEREWLKEEEEEELEYMRIKKFKIYDCHLEDVPVFKSFLDQWVSFPMLRGKIGDEEEDELTRLVGHLKGQILIYRLPKNHTDTSEPKLKLNTFLPSNEPVGVLVRVYVIKGIDLHPADIDNRADPFLTVKCGNKEEKDDRNFIPNQLNPVFGRVFSFNAKLPHDNMLTVQVWDYDQFSANDLIGETKIDIENRFFTKHRACCGLKRTYEIFGYNQWQDPEAPSMIVDRFCVNYNLPRPEYDLMHDQVTICGHTYYADTEIVDEIGVVKPTKEHLALEILHHWDEILPGFPLVPEHIETRSLYSPEHPGVVQGKLEMWVDIFSMELPPPGPPIVITPRKPVNYELRLIIWNTTEVVLNDASLLSDDMSSDIYVKGWMDLMAQEMQQTDVHYRSLTGDGNFNWRFVYQFAWLAAEKKMVVTRKDGLFDSDVEEMKLPARLNLQVYDADMMSSDDCLGMLTLILNKMPRGAKSAKMCTMQLLDKDAPMCNLFKLKKMKGWWPVIAKVKPDDEECGKKGKKKKKKKKKKNKKGENKEQDKFEMEPEEITLVQGKIEMEFHLLPMEEAEKSPVGKARADPEPLSKPNRPDTSFGWFLNPLTLFKKVIWKKLKWLIIKSFIAALFIALIVLFIYASPGYTVKKILGA